MTSDDNLKTFYYALAYNIGILVLSLLLWILVVRPIRRDEFKPNAKPDIRNGPYKNSSYDEVLMQKGQMSSGDSNEEIPPDRSGWWLTLVKEYRWMRDLWAWNISDFGSTDVYLYLLFLKKTAFLFGTISALTCGIGLPVIWTASENIISPIDGQMRPKGFFERSVITNVGTTDFKRLWTLYALIWVVLFIGLYCSLTFYRSVRSDEFRPAVLLFKRRRASLQRMRRFMANKHTVCIHGISRTILNSRPITEKLYQFIDPSEVIAVHVAIDHSEAYIAKQVFEKYLARLLEAQKHHQEEKMRTKKHFFSSITETAEREAALDETLSFFNQSGLPQVVQMKSLKSADGSFDGWDRTSGRVSPLSSEGELSPVSSTGYPRSQETFKSHGTCKSRHSRYLPSNPDLVETLLQSTEPDSVLSTRHINNADNMRCSDGQDTDNSPIITLTLPSYVEVTRSRKPPIRHTDSMDESSVAMHSAGCDSLRQRSLESEASHDYVDEFASDIDYDTSYVNHAPHIYSNLGTGRHGDDSPTMSIRDSNWSSRLSSQITSQLLTRMHASDSSRSHRHSRHPHIGKAHANDTLDVSSAVYTSSTKRQQDTCRTPVKLSYGRSYGVNVIPVDDRSNVPSQFTENSSLRESPRQIVHTVPTAFSSDVSPKTQNENVGCSCCHPFKRDPKILEAKVSKWEEKVLSQYSILNRIRKKPPQRNVGIAFVCFKKQEAARFMLAHDFGDSQCPVFDPNSMNLLSYTCRNCKRDIGANKCLCRRWKSEWKVRPAPPPEDILWENIHIDELSRTIRRVGINLLIFLLSLILTSSAMLADALIPFAQHVEVIIKKATFFKLSFSGWLAPMLLYLINALLLPLLVSWAADVTRFWKASARERAVLHGNVNFMVLNSLVFPILGTTSIRTLLIFLYETSVSDLITVIGQLVAGASGSFLIRYVLNTTFVNSSMQLLQLPMFSHQRIMAKFGKNAPKWNFDFGYWYAFHLSVLAVCLTFSVDIPLVPAIGAVFFTAKYWVDKYNMSFNVWRITGESAGAVASSAVSFMLYFHALFLFSMAGYFVTVGIHAESVLTNRRDSSTRRNILLTRDDILESKLPFYDSSTLTQTFVPRRLLWVVIPHESKAKALVIGGFSLLAGSVLLIILTFGQKAQRTIVDHHAGTLRRVARLIYVKFIRCCSKIGVPIAPKSASESSGLGHMTPGQFNELSSSEKEDLVLMYCHPYSRYMFEPEDLMEQTVYGHGAEENENSVSTETQESQV